MAANWWHQGADGIQTFNFNHAPDFPYGKAGVWKTHLLAYREIGSPKTLKRKDKVFLIQRRGGGHGTTVVPNPEDWTTPRLMYFNTNMFASLPAALDNDGKADRHWMPGKGNINWAQFVDAFPANTFDGCLMLEVIAPRRNRSDCEAYLAQAFDKAKEIQGQLLTRK